MTTANATPVSKPFSELLVISDDRSWIWATISDALSQAKYDFVRLPSNTPIRPSWQRFEKTARIIILWENTHRTGGAIVEEILDVDPMFDVSERIIVVTYNPTREDIVYINELGILRVVKMRNRPADREQATQELLRHVATPAARNSIEKFWQSTQATIDRGGLHGKADHIEALEQDIRNFMSKFPNEKRTAKYLDAMASLAAMRGDAAKALEFWEFALSANPNFFRALNNLVNFHISRKDHNAAFSLLQRIHEHNRANIMRMVKMGNIKRDQGESERAEHYYKLALERDQFCSGALNGMAELMFLRGQLEDSRQLIAKSHLAEQLATRLNRMGIEMVQKKAYAPALEHYTKAQYVLPQQEKGPMLFYNIGLCYAKWSKYSKAAEFLRIALIKDPSYQKASELLQKVEERLNETSGAQEQSQQNGMAGILGIKDPFDQVS